ncbi:MAG TPA: L-lactate permease [Candidatus Sulfotelmatobacter sp.]|nr:L-lactate permease [Candidatus Sulfotelmatobacter sp.]
MTAMPLGAWQWVPALAPIAVLLVVILILRRSATQGGLLAWGAALLLGWALFGAGADDLAIGSLRGLVFSFEVLYIIWPALFLYQIVVEAGATRGIGIGIRALTRDRVLQILILGFAFTSFLQGVASFGVPVAVGAPLLLGLGFRPMQATLAPLIGHAWAVTLGGMASSFLALRAVTGLPGHELGLWTAGLLGLTCIGTGFLVAHLVGGWKGIRRDWWEAAAIGGSMAAVQFLLAWFDYWIIASFGAGLAGLLVGVALTRLSSRRPEGERRGGMRELHYALAPYYALICIVAAATFLPPLRWALHLGDVPVPLPKTTTALGWTVGAVTPRLQLLAHPGALILYTCGVALAWYGRLGTGHLEVRAVARRTVWLGLPATGAVLCMMMLATVMSGTGMTFVLARAAIDVTGRAYPFVAPFVGLLGCFVTGNNTTSNVLFGTVQRDAAMLLRVNPFLMAALQTTGGALGGMVTPAKVLMACATVGLRGQEGAVIRRALGPCLALTALAGLGGLVAALLS